MDDHWLPNLEKGDHVANLQFGNGIAESSDPGRIRWETSCNLDVSPETTEVYPSRSIAF